MPEYRTGAVKGGGQFNALSGFLNIKKSFDDAVRQHQYEMEKQAREQQGQMKLAGVNQGTYTPTNADMGIPESSMAQPQSSGINNMPGTESTPPATSTAQGWHPSTKKKSYELSQEEANVLGQQLVSGRLAPNQLSRIQKSQAIVAAQAIDPNYNPAKADIQFSVNKTGAGSFEKLYNNVTSFEKTFRKNADVALQLSDNFPRTRIPLLNRAILAGKTNITGDPEASKLLTALYTVATEYARLTSAPGATGSMITDSAREEARSLLNAWQNQGTLRGQLDPENGIMSIDARNRIQALDETRGEIQGRYGNSQNQSNAPAVGTVKGGYRFKGGDPSQQSSWIKI